MVFALKGALVGFAVAAPVGPIGLLILRRSLVDGRKAGFVSGLGAATADIVAAAAATFGLQAAMTLVEQHRVWLHGGGGLFMIGLGWHLLRTPPATEPSHDRPVHERTLWLAYGSTLGLTLLNPMTFLGMIGLCLGVGLGHAELSWREALLFTAGAGFGSALWWWALSSAAAWLGGQLKPRQMAWVNRIAGAAVIAFGVVEIATLWH